MLGAGVGEALGSVAITGPSGADEAPGLGNRVPDPNCGTWDSPWPSTLVPGGGVLPGCGDGPVEGCGFGEGEWLVVGVGEGVGLATTVILPVSVGGLSAAPLVAVYVMTRTAENFTATVSPFATVLSNTGLAELSVNLTLLPARPVSSLTNVMVTPA
ncbi:MAG: hypothetical protein QOG53_1658 [Frankiales bacterium]|nr:hypothetical protein [Frankiales bacterium]